MYVMRRLKSDSPFPSLYIPIAAAVTFFILISTTGPQVAFYFIAAVLLGYATFTFIGYLHVRSTGLLAVTLYQASAGVFVLLAPANFHTGHLNPQTGLAFAAMIISGVWMFVLALSRRIKWRGREILELAAQPVDETAEAGFTDRPRPAGKAEFTERELREFAEFCRHEMIAMPFYERHRVVLVPVLTGRGETGFLLGLRRDYAQYTWIAFDFDGSVSVHVARRDYLLYREDLSFDQLCASLGQVFIEFLDLYRTGKSVRIIDRLNAMPVGIFS